MEAHVLSCDACHQYDMDLVRSRAALIEGRLFHQGPQSFSWRVLVAYSRDRTRRQGLIWRPTITGAVTAAVAVGAILQLLYSQIGVARPVPEGTAARGLRRDAPLRILTPREPSLFDAPVRIAKDPDRNDA